MGPHGVLGFLAAVFPLVATPGASLTLLTQRVGTGDRRHGPAVVLGTVTGLYLHASLAAFGLSALLLRSSQAFTAVRLGGAVYLVLLGLWTWRDGGRAGAPATADGRARSQGQSQSQGRPGPRPRPQARALSSTYRQALLGNVLNPKAASIFLTLVPQFLAPHRPVLPQVFELATAQALLVAAWLLAWSVVVDKAGALRSPRAKAALHRATAALLVGLGLRTALN
ncbi:LysE family translocator [Kitasatospora sp. NBC_01302]|uniref:LysE family translocator n=1 Tax=Kitasatospora sp. NBC_01302 TaxID=2903575 RepID=UPI002E10677E